MSCKRIHARFDRLGVREWAARTPASPGADCQHLCELTPDAYDRVFGALRRAARRRGTLGVLGAGCGRGAAHAVASGLFSAAHGWEVVPERAAAARAALADVGLARRVTVAEASFCGGESPRACALFSFDVAFDSATMREAALVARRAPRARAMASFRPPSKWAAAGLEGAQLVESGRVQTSGGESFTYYVYSLNRG